MGIGQTIKKWRTSKGFGVHSPFAYDLITKVIGEHDAHYYAYAEIDSFCPRGRQIGLSENFAGFDYSIPEARLLFRLLCRFNPSAVLEVGQGHEVTYTILSRAVPKATRLRWIMDRPPVIPPDGTLFILVNCMRDLIVDPLRQLILKEMHRPDGVVVFVRGLHQRPSQRLWEQIYVGAPSGMDFTNGQIGIFCAFRGLPRQSFDFYF